MASLSMQSSRRESKLPITSANSDTKTAQQFPPPAPSSLVEPRAPVLSVDQLFTTLQDFKDNELGRWYQEKVHFDWEPPVLVESKGLYALRTPSSHRHAYFVAQVKSLINHRVETLVDRRGTPEQIKIANALKNVHQRDSPNINLRTIRPLKTKNNPQPNTQQPFGTKAPDAAFHHQIGDILPTLVLEVVFSQPQKALKALAQRYIIGSMHEIGCIIVFNLPHNQSSKIAATTQETQSQELAIVSIWRRDVRHEGVRQIKSLTCDLAPAPFLPRSGEACDTVLELRLSDFLPKQVSDTVSSDETKIEIPFSKLREALGNAQSTPDLSEISPALALATSSESITWDSGEEPLPEDNPASHERNFTAVE
ncbi:hypothetical protein KC351_g652 [Hortaea werneckii]|nr:hypothetical protein KC351_g652 [Hortaea werneckii]